MRPIQSYNPFLPQTAQIPAEFAGPDLCCARKSAMSLSIPNPSFLIPNCNYTFSAKERDPETGLSYFGSRYYSSDLGIWLSVDPMAGKYPSLSPYTYCADNPVRLVDPDGEEVNPIFSTCGELLGTDSKGWKGTAIVMEKKDFKNGMKHDDAMKKGTELDKYGKGINISDSDWEKVKANGGERMSPTVENHSNEDVYFKPETTYGEYKNDGAYPLGAGKDLYMPVDGIAVPHLKKNQVFKVTDNTRVSISNTSISYGANKFAMCIRGGWKNTNWLNSRHRGTSTYFLMYPGISPAVFNDADYSWDNLFEKSN